jgi:catechol 2,3-dioxygenase
VSEAVYLHDPEGNGIEIYADRPRSAWRWEQTPDGPRVLMANDRLDMIGLRALATSPWTGAPPGTTIGHVHLQVGDAAEAERFYAGVVGFEVTRQSPQAVFLSSGGYHHHLAANTWESLGAGPRDPRQAGLAWLQLKTQRPVVETIARRTGAADLTRDGLRDKWGTQILFDIA